MLEIAAKELKNMAKAFYDVAQIKIVLYDEYRNIIYSYPNDMCEFCKYIRNNHQLKNKCLNCDNVGLDICEKTGKPYIYRCHMGLTEAVAPIIENGVTIGYMMLGQVLIEKDINIVKKKIFEICEKYNLDFKELKEKTKDLRIMNNSSVNSAVNIMSMCSCYLYVNKIIQNKHDILSYQLKNYIDTHISEKISIDELCNKLFISRSKLYIISKEAFGTGITDYIRNKQFETAKTLLKETTIPISVIYERAGFTSANYFIRVFKKQFGITPKEYRKNAKNNL